MLGLNTMAWLGLLVWVGVPLFAFLIGGLLWRRSKTLLGKRGAVLASIAILFTPMLVSNGVKYYYDEQVRELCAKDGGVRVYETVSLPVEKFDAFGVVRIPIKRDAKPGDEYYYEWRVLQHREGNPSVRRDHFLVYRKSDMKLLGEAVSYARLGGDLPGLWDRSSFRCPENSGDSVLEQRIFIQSKGE